MTQAFASALIGLCLAGAAGAQIADPLPADAQADPIVTLRASTNRLEPRVVQFIARNSVPMQLPDQPFGVRTPRDIVSALCGDFRQTYYDEFLSANGLEALPPDLPLTRSPGSLVWPACLYITKPSEPVAVLPDETVSSLFARLTGGANSTVGLGQFLRSTGKPSTADKRLTGDSAAVTLLTAPVEITPRGMDAVEYLRQVTALSEAAGATPSVQGVASLQGEIVVGEIASGASICSPQVGPVFNVAGLVNAYRHSADLSEIHYRDGRIADVVIVDNGFFGADQRLGEDAFVGSPFSRKNFVPNATSAIAESVRIDRTIYPLNYQNEVEVTEVSGHGTHTAGLALGGPDFVSEGAGLAGAKPWVRLTILNVGRGQRSLVGGAAGVLQSHLSTSSGIRIVNMSLAFDGHVDSGASTALHGLVNNRQNLYVAAAGNHGREVSGAMIYPAALGGPTQSNVVTVAALDGEGRIAAFSNWGSSAVDLAAPGCEIRSWLDNRGGVTALSGTSQAAALTTMTAAMLSSLWGNATPHQIKLRLVLSGELLPPEDQGRTAFGVRLDPVRALYWFEDYLRVEAGPDAGEYLGKVDRLPALRCAADPASHIRDARDIWAIKRANGVGRLFHGRNANRLEAPCPFTGAATEAVEFTPTHRVTSAGLEVMAADRPLRVRHDVIADLILGNPKAL